MVRPVGDKIRSLVSKARQELTVLETLHPEVEAALLHVEERHPGFRQVLDEAYGYAVFPRVAKAAIVAGGAFGKGEVFERGKQIGYAGVIQLTIGVQFGGDTFTEVITFQNKAALERFKSGRVRPAASASAVLVKAGAAASADPAVGATVYVFSQGGMLLEAALGGQKFFFRPSALGRGKRPVAREHAKGHRDTKTRGRGNTPKRGSKKPGRAAHKID